MCVCASLLWFHQHRRHLCDRSQFKSGSISRAPCLQSNVQPRARFCRKQKRETEKQLTKMNKNTHAHARWLTGWAIWSARRARIQIEILIICAIIASNKGDNLVCGFCGYSRSGGILSGVCMSGGVGDIISIRGKKAVSSASAGRAATRTLGLSVLYNRPRCSARSLLQSHAPRAIRASMGLREENHKCRRERRESAHRPRHI